MVQEFQSGSRISSGCVTGTYITEFITSSTQAKAMRLLCVVAEGLIKRGEMKVLFLCLQAFSGAGGIEKFNKAFIKALQDNKDLTSLHTIFKV